MADLVVSEEWRVVAEFPDYEVSNLGRVRRITPMIQRHPRRPDILIVRRPAGALMKLKETSEGYRSVKLFAGGEGAQIAVHVLVCHAFHGPAPTPKHEVAHGDGTRTNNRDDNLRWVTHKQNAQDMVSHGRSSRGIKNPKAKLTPDDVLEIRRLRQKGVMLKTVARVFNISVAQACSAATGRTWGWLK